MMLVRLMLLAVAWTAGTGDARASGPEPAPPARAVPNQAARTLDAVAIEGEVDVPQVLFISSRDHLRFHDDTARRYRPGPLDVIRGATVPVRLRIVLTDLPIPPATTAGPGDPTPTPAEETTR